MRIDTHQHYWRYLAEDFPWIDDTKAALKRDFTPDDSLPEMRAAGFDASIAVQARQTADETASLLAFADAHPTVVGVVGWVDLLADDVEAQLADVASHPKLVGIRHIVQDEPDDRFLLKPEFLRGVVVLGLLAMLCHAVRLNEEHWYRNSTLVPYAEHAGNVLRALVGESRITSPEAAA